MPNYGESDDGAFSVAEIAKRFSVKHDLVLGWIRAGHLIAVDVGKSRKKLPRWRITPQALADFERAVQSAAAEGSATDEAKTRCRLGGLLGFEGEGQEIESLKPLRTIEEVATHLTVNRDAVSQWIANMELVAVNVNRFRGAGRPTWRIRPEDLENFEMARRTVPKPRPPRNKKPPDPPTRKWF